MSYKRKKSMRIDRADQLRVIASPASIEIIEALQTGGAATVAQLGVRLGRRSNSLHYHIQKLKRVKLVVEVGSQRSGARTQLIYDVPADRYDGHAAPKLAQHRKLTNDAVAAILRQTNRNFARASEQSSVLEKGKMRNIMVSRHKAWLPRKKLAEVNLHLDALAKIFASSHTTQSGQLCALTLVLTPLQQNRS